MSRVILIIDLEAHAVEILRAAETEDDLVEHLADCLLSQTAAGRILRTLDPDELLVTDGLSAAPGFGDRVRASMKRPLADPGPVRKHIAGKQADPSQAPGARCYSGMTPGTRVGEDA